MAADAVVSSFQGAESSSLSAPLLLAEHSSSVTPWKSSDYSVSIEDTLVKSATSPNVSSLDTRQQRLTYGFELWMTNLESELTSTAARQRHSTTIQRCFRRSYFFTRDLVHDYEFWGNIFNILLSAGYVFADYARGYIDNHAVFTSALYVLLAALTLVEANCFFYCWQGADTPLWQAYAAEVTNILASVGYCATSFLYMYEEEESVLLAVLLIEGAMVIIFFISGLLYLYSWLAVVENGKWRGLTWRDPDMWANAVNISAASVYLISSAGGIWFYYAKVKKTRLTLQSSGWTALSSTVNGSQTLKAMSRVNIYGDVLYLVSAVLYTFSWLRDAIEEMEVSRQDAAEEAAAGNKTTIRSSLAIMRASANPNWLTMSNEEVIAEWARLSRECKARLQMDIGFRPMEPEVDDPFDSFQTLPPAWTKACLRYALKSGSSNHLRKRKWRLTHKTADEKSLLSINANG